MYRNIVPGQGQKVNQWTYCIIGGTKSPWQRIQQFKKGGSFTKVLDNRMEELKLTTPPFAESSASYK